MIREEEGVKTNQGNYTEHPMEARPRTTSLIKDLNRNFFSKAESQILERGNLQAVTKMSITCHVNKFDLKWTVVFIEIDGGVVNCKTAGPA